MNVLSPGPIKTPGLVELAGPDAAQTGLVLLSATVLGWFGAWLATGHHLRQTRPTDL